MKTLVKIGFIAVFALFISSCDQGEKEKAAEDNNTNKERVFPVRIQKIEKQKIPRTVESAADLVAFKEIYFAPASPGRINKIYVDVGNKVFKGKLLVQMDGTQMNQAYTQYETAKIMFERMDTLFKLNSISKQQYDQAKAQYDLAKSSYGFSSRNTTLRSPINGIVTGKYFENGEMFSGAPNTQAGKAAVITLMQINPMKAVLSITQSMYPYIKEGMEVDLSIDILEGKTFKGKVYKVYPTIEPATRTFKTEIIIENKEEVLRPGMYAKLILHLGETEAVVVPAVSVLKQEGTNKRFVFLENNGTAKRIEVEIGKRFDDKVEIISEEISEGDIIIVEGQAKLLNGSKVKLAGK